MLNLGAKTTRPPEQQEVRLLAQGHFGTTLVSEKRSSFNLAAGFLQLVHAEEPAALFYLLQAAVIIGSLEFS